MTTCPECGALARGESTCQNVFDECLVKEFIDPYFGVVHHLTVATYMVQHSSKLSREGWLAMRTLLKEFVIDNKLPEEIRRKNKSMMDSGNRSWKISARDALPKISRFSWTGTIMDIRLESAELYCADVSGWAKATLADAAGVEPQTPA